MLVQVEGKHAFALADAAMHNGRLVHMERDERVSPPVSTHWYALGRLLIGLTFRWRPWTYTGIKLMVRRA